VQNLSESFKISHSYRQKFSAHVFFWAAV